jgi:hypothetical protein
LQPSWRGRLVAPCRWSTGEKGRPQSARCRQRRISRTCASTWTIRRLDFMPTQQHHRACIAQGATSSFPSPPPPLSNQPFRPSHLSSLISHHGRNSTPLSNPHVIASDTRQGTRPPDSALAEPQIHTLHAEVRSSSRRARRAGGPNDGGDVDHDDVAPYAAAMHAPSARAKVPAGGGARGGGVSARPATAGGAYGSARASTARAKPSVRRRISALFPILFSLYPPFSSPTISPCPHISPTILPPFLTHLLSYFLPSHIPHPPLEAIT